MGCACPIFKAMGLEGPVDRATVLVPFWAYPLSLTQIDGNFDVEKLTYFLGIIPIYV